MVVNSCSIDSSVLLVLGSSGILAYHVAVVMVLLSGSVTVASSVILSFISARLGVFKVTTGLSDAISNVVVAVPVSP